MNYQCEHRRQATARQVAPIYALFTVGVALWSCYDVVIDAWSIIFANTLTLALFVFAMKLCCG